MNLEWDDVVWAGCKGGCDALDGGTAAGTVQYFCLYYSKSFGLQPFLWETQTSASVYD